MANIAPIKNLAESLTEEALKLRLQSDEHDFVERKSISDRKGWLETAVAFANSTPIGWPAVLFVGVDDKGLPNKSTRLDDVMKSVSSSLDRAYPAIYRYVVPLHLPAGDCLAVVIPGSEHRPHFAGLSYIRDGTQTKEASSTQFDRLIAYRNSKARKILEYRGAAVTIERIMPTGRAAPFLLIVEDCNDHYATLRPTQSYHLHRYYFPLDQITISFDGDKQTLKLETS